MPDKTKKKTRKAAIAAPAVPPVPGFKGFNLHLQCTPDGKSFQYEVGKDYTHNGPVNVCASGFHFCENPLDVLAYYGPADSRFAEVEGIDCAKRDESDSKVACKTIRIKTEISLRSLLDSGVKFILEKVDWSSEKKATNTGDRSAATNTGDRSAATVEGTQSFALATGYESKARGALGCWLILAEWDKRGEKIIAAKMEHVDGIRIKAATWYQLTVGEFAEVNL